MVQQVQARAETFKFTSSAFRSSATETRLQSRHRYDWSPSLSILVVLCLAHLKSIVASPVPQTILTTNLVVGTPTTALVSSVQQASSLPSSSSIAQNVGATQLVTSAISSRSIWIPSATNFLQPAASPTTTTQSTTNTAGDTGSHNIPSIGQLTRVTFVCVGAVMILLLCYRIWYFCTISDSPLRAFLCIPPQGINLLGLKIKGPTVRTPTGPPPSYIYSQRTMTQVGNVTSSGSSTSDARSTIASDGVRTLARRAATGEEVRADGARIGRRDDDDRMDEEDAGEEGKDLPGYDGHDRELPAYNQDPTDSTPAPPPPAIQSTSRGLHVTQFANY